MSKICLNTDEVRRRAYLKGISEYDLLTAAGLNKTIFQRLRRNAVKSTSPKTIAKLAAVLECEPADLITDENSLSSCTKLKLNTDEVRRRAYLKGLTEKDLLIRADLNTNLISISRRTGNLPIPQSIRKLAAVLECEPADLITEIKKGDRYHAED